MKVIAYVTATFLPATFVSVSLYRSMLHALLGPNFCALLSRFLAWCFSILNPVKMGQKRPSLYPISFGCTGLLQHLFH